MPRPGVTFPPIDYLANLTASAIDGSCIVTDPRGTDRYAYVLQPISADNWEFYKFDLWSRTAQPLSNPARAATTITARAKMVFDASGGILATPTIWLFAPDTAGGTFFRWQSYNIATDVWTARSSVLAGMAAAASIDTSLCHPCNLLGAAPGPDRLIYANGDGGAWGAAGPSNLAVYDITTDTWARLVGAGPRGGAPAIGSSLDWLPQCPGYLFSFRGGGSGIIDVYGIVGNAWTAIAAAAIDPPLPFDSEGFETTTLFRYPWRILCANYGQIIAVDLTSLVVPPVAATTALVAAIDGADGTAHQGNGLFAWQVGDKLYIGIRPHGSTAVQRIRMIL